MSARLEKPAMNLLRPLEILTELGLVRRDIPFGELAKNSKRTLYTIADPFLRFWYRYVFPSLSACEQELYDQPMAVWTTTQSQHIGSIWEDLARESVPHLSIHGLRWGQAQRWWGKNSAGEAAEIGVVAESLDGSSILLGEVMWGNAAVDSERKRLEGLGPLLPFVGKKRVLTACWAGRTGSGASRGNTISPESVLKVLR